MEQHLIILSSMEMSHNLDIFQQIYENIRGSEKTNKLQRKSM